jgi:hypothetical protein
MSLARTDLHSLQAVSRSSCLDGGGYQGVNMSRDMRMVHMEKGYHSYEGAYSGRTVSRDPAPPVIGMSKLHHEPVVYAQLRRATVADRPPQGLLGHLDVRDGDVNGLAGVGESTDWYVAPHTYPYGHPGNNVNRW